MSAVRFFLFLSLVIINLSFTSLCSPQSDADTLIKFKQSLSQGNLNGWIPGPGISPCLKKWVGVMCNGEDIIGLHLMDLNLSGTIDVEFLRKLRYLRSISFARNSFTGPIPEFNKLNALKSLYLSHNQFSGDIPNDYFAPMKYMKKVWLNGNQFTGRIPESLMHLPHLLELHLEGNNFSGPIPPLKLPTVLISLNLSLNQLEGRIPESYAKFSADAFRGNAGLCGRMMANGCMTEAPTPSPSLSPSPSASSSPLGQIQIQNQNQNQNQTGTNRAKPRHKDNGKAILVALTIFFLLCILIGSICSRLAEKSELSRGRNRKSGRDKVMPVHLPPESIHRRSAETSRRKPGSKKNSTASFTKGGGDMVILNGERGEFGLQDLMKASAEVLENGMLGSAYKAKMGNGLTVVAKRLKGMNKSGKDEFAAEMKRFAALNHPNVLTPLAYHFRKEEKLVVTEYVPKGSLAYALHGTRDLVHAQLNWPTRLKIIKGVARGLEFIHTEFATSEVPHGNLKSSNVLLTENYDPLLSDYGFQPLVSSKNVAQALFAYKSPEYLKHQQISPKSDVYCLGIVILEIMTGKCHSQYQSKGRGGIDIMQWVQISISEKRAQELIDPEIANNASSISNMLQVLDIGVACVESNPEKRLHLNEAITRIEEIS
ncbi:hypothetical protein GQ457_07G045630 [Hibiscus cannabinus]